MVRQVSPSSSPPLLPLPPLPPPHPPLNLPRKRPNDSKSNFLVRMIRLDKSAMLRDMLLNKEVDVYVEYENSGKVDGRNGRFLVEPKVRKDPGPEPTETHRLCIYN